MPEISKFFKNGRQLWLPFGFAVLFGGFGAYLLFTGHAATTPLQSSVTWKEDNGMIVNVNSGLCLSTPGASEAANGTQLSLSACDSTRYNQNQYWSYGWSDDGTLGGSIENGYSQCLDSSSSSPGAGSPAEIQTCNDSATSQTWDINPDDDTIRVNGLCLGVSGNATASGSPVIIASCSTSASSGSSTSSGGGATTDGGDAAATSPATGSSGGTSGRSGNSGSSNTGSGSNATSNGSSDLVLTPSGAPAATTGGTANRSGNSASGSSGGASASDTGQPSSGSSTRSAIGATVVVFAIALAGAGFVLRIRKRQQRDWEARNAAAPPVILQTPPPLPPPTRRPYTLPAPPPGWRAVTNPGPLPPPTRVLSGIPMPPQPHSDHQSQPEQPAPDTAPPPDDQPDKPKADEEDKADRKPSEQDELVVHIKH